MKQLGDWARRIARTGFYRLFPGRRKARQILPDDLYLVSYPRSGNTWMRYLLANVLEPDKSWNITNLHRVVPDIYAPWPQDWIERTPRILKSHEACQLSYPKVIYIYRDGRDVAVSYYDFMRKLKGYQGSFDQFLQRFLHGKLPYGSWQDHVSSWLLDDHSVNVLPIKYESLVADTAGELERLCGFLQAQWSSELIASAIARSSREKTREDYRVFKYDTHWSKGFEGGVAKRPQRWREVFSYEQNESFWMKAGVVANKMGYPRE